MACWVLLLRGVEEGEEYDSYPDVHHRAYCDLLPVSPELADVSDRATDRKDRQLHRDSAPGNFALDIRDYKLVAISQYYILLYLLFAVAGGGEFYGSEGLCELLCGRGECWGGGDAAGGGEGVLGVICLVLLYYLIKIYEKVFFHK